MRSASRRALIGGAAATGALAAVAAMPTPTIGPDDPHPAWEREWKALIEWCNGPAPGGRDLVECWQWHRANELEGLIGETPTRTIAGALVQLRMVAYASVGQIEAEHEEGLVNAIATLGQFAGPGDAPGLPAPAVAATGPGSDAGLLRLGRELDEAWTRERAACAGPGRRDDDEVDAACDATGAVAERIEALPAATLAGLRVKARAVAWCRNGEPMLLDGETTDVRLAGSIVRDLLRAGGAGHA